MILIKLIGITSLLVLGWKIVTSEDMLLESVGDFAEAKAKEGKRYYELLFCQWCMPSAWSLLGFVFAYGLGIISIEWKLLFLYPLCVCGSSLVCGVTWSLYKLIESTINRNEAEVEAIFDFSDEIEYEENIFENQHN